MPSRNAHVADDPMRCGSCGEPLPAAVLISESAGARPWILSRRSHLLGRAPECDLRIADLVGVSRQQARLDWQGNGFEIADAGSTNGTFVNGRRLAQGERVRLCDGDRIRLGDHERIYREVRLGASAPVPYDEFLRLVRELGSLDPRVVVARSLDLLRALFGVERGILVDAGVDPRLRELLTSLDDPSLAVSRSSIQRAIATAQKVTVAVGSGAAEVPFDSIHELHLRRIWVNPIRGLDGRPVAAVYLDSTDSGSWVDVESERLMDAVVEQIGLALRNASLHDEVVSLKEGLEARVVARTRELEESRAILIGQDRLATLGRLVAAIAHELNNPVGAMASFAETLRGLVDPLVRVPEDLRAAFPDAVEAESARRLLLAALASASDPPRDSRERRALEDRLRSHLEGRGVPRADTLARRFARVGLESTTLDPAASLLASRGDVLADLAERLHTFGRAVRTIGDCAGNVARIVDGLKVYAHLDRSQLEEADIRRGLEATLTVLQARIPAGVQVETRFDAIPPFPHRPGELTQVWTNLVDNALLAMGETGKLTLETHDAGDRVQIVVADTGEGIPEALRGRVFDLDVTTRGPGAGLGLGLPICKQIVERRHGGWIEFTSRPGRTVFTVVLPKNPPFLEETPR